MKHRPDSVPAWKYLIWARHFAGTFGMSLSQYVRKNGYPYI